MYFFYSFSGFSRTIQATWDCEVELMKSQVEGLEILYESLLIRKATTDLVAGY